MIFKLRFEIFEKNKHYISVQFNLNDQHVSLKAIFIDHSNLRTMNKKNYF